MEHTLTYEDMDPYTACAIAEGFSDGEPTEDELNAAWQYLIDTGMAWTLQGWYGRSAMSLIEAGTCLPPDRSANPYISRKDYNDAKG